MRSPLFVIFTAPGAIFIKWGFLHIFRDGVALKVFIRIKVEFVSFNELVVDLGKCLGLKKCFSIIILFLIFDSFMGKIDKLGFGVFDFNFLCSMLTHIHELEIIRSQNCNATFKITSFWINFTLLESNDAIFD